MRDEIIESYEPTPKQLDFHQSTHFMRCFMGGFGAGKTKTGVWEAIDQCMRQPGNRVGIFRDTMGDLRDTTMATFFEECPPEFIYTYRKKDETVLLVNGSQILFRSFRMYKTSKANQNEGKLKGINLGGFYIDEANECTKEQILFLMGRLRLDTVTWRGGWLTTNPPPEDHWLYDMFDGPNADRKRYHIVHASTRENKHLPPDFITNLEREYGPQMAKKFLDGHYGRMVVGQPVYGEVFLPTRNGEPWHCRPTKFRSQYGAVHRYWDFGWHHPAVVWAQVTPGGVWKVHKELMGDKILIRDFARKVISISNDRFAGARFQDFGDPAGNQKSDKDDRSTIEILRTDFSIKMQSRFSLIREGVDIIYDTMQRIVDGEPAFQINDEECPILVEGFQHGYVRAKDSTASDEPIKDGWFEHPQDALRMGAINVFGSHSGPSHSQSFPVGGPSFGVRPARAKMTQGGTNGWYERPRL